MKINERLDDVELIRPITILLVLIYHSFAIFTGAWNPTYNFENISAYYWLAKFSYSFMLPCFVFISGYVYYHKQKHSTHTINFIQFSYKKFNRLIVPSIFFSLLYYLIFVHKGQEFNLNSFLFDIIGGVGHLWFLPMLFWCFILANLMEKLNVKIYFKLVILGIISLISFTIKIPLGINHAFNYLFYFYLGLFVIQNKDYIVKITSDAKIICLNFSLFILLFFLLTSLNDKIVLFTVESYSLFFRATAIVMIKLFTMIISVYGIFNLYIFINFLIIKKIYKASKHIKYLNSVCFGVYIYHQFILKYLYYDTILAENINIHIFPFLGLIVTLIFSVFLTNLTLKLRVGRYLIK